MIPSLALGRAEAEALPDNMQDMGRLAAHEGYDNARRLLADMPRTLETVAVVVASAQAEVDRLSAAFIERAARDRKRVACKAGCGMCCHQHVLPSASELALVAHAIVAEEREAVREAAAASATRAAGHSHEARYRQGIPCVALEDGNCGIYPYRPTACRSYYSTSLIACRKDWSARFRNGPPAGVPLLMDPQIMAASIMVGVDAALYDLWGLEAERAEFAAGLCAMLTDDGAARWLAGERVLRPIAYGEVGADGLTPHARAIIDTAARERRDWRPGLTR